MDPGSESLPPPRGTIAAALPERWGGRAAQRPARPEPCDARSTRSPGGAADGRVFRPTWNTFRKTNGELITQPAGDRVPLARGEARGGAGVKACSACVSRLEAGEVSSIKSSSIIGVHFSLDSGSAYFGASPGQLGSDQKPQAEETRVRRLTSNGGRDLPPRALPRQARG
ncbi:unnamed protein product [Rangifer tarandus platyrhynchus]|uniref:Uncharacterized protein n=1 Tax=Rangifer tarandus platyrhynchus TaxID=3082113 RepID=A0ABN8Y5S7_RANTA|nr:unnamed protein product [Rangifer tarandus platyrhynchus]